MRSNAKRKSEHCLSREWARQTPPDRVAVIIAVVVAIVALSWFPVLGMLLGD